MHWRPLALVLPLLGVGELMAHEYYSHRAPAPEDYAALFPAIKGLSSPGELVVVAPSWGEPLVRHALGDTFMPLSMLARADNDGFSRAIEVGFLGQKSSELTGWREVKRERVGPFLLRVLTNPTPKPALERLLDRVAVGDAMVYEGDETTGKAACPFLRHAPMHAGGLGGDPTVPAERFTCPSREGVFVGVTLIDDEQFRPRRCVYAPPSSRGPLTITVPHMRLGDELVGHGGLPWLISRDGVGTPISLRAMVGDRMIGEQRFEDEQGFMRFTWATQGFRGSSADVTLIVDSAIAEARRFCFTLESR